MSFFKCKCSSGRLFQSPGAKTAKERSSCEMIRATWRQIWSLKSHDQLWSWSIDASGLKSGLRFMSRKQFVDVPGSICRGNPLTSSVNVCFTWWLPVFFGHRAFCECVSHLIRSLAASFWIICSHEKMKLHKIECVQGVKAANKSDSFSSGSQLLKAEPPLKTQDFKNKLDVHEAPSWDVSRAWGRKHAWPHGVRKQLIYSLRCLEKSEWVKDPVCDCFYTSVCVRAHRSKWKTWKCQLWTKTRSLSFPSPPFFWHPCLLPPIPLTWLPVSLLLSSGSLNSLKCVGWVRFDSEQLYRVSTSRFMLNNCEVKSFIF